MNLWEFEEGQHKPINGWEREGKPEWPDMVHVTLGSRSAAWRIARYLLQQIEDDEQRITFTLFGKLEEADE